MSVYDPNDDEEIDAELPTALVIAATVLLCILGAAAVLCVWVMLQ